MPKIQWTNLPPALRDHRFERLRERKIRIEDLYALKLWRESEPEAPEGLWNKDSGSFKVCGEGKFPRPFLLAGQSAKGKRLYGEPAQDGDRIAFLRGDADGAGIGSGRASPAPTARLRAARSRRWSAWRGRSSAPPTRDF